MSDLSLTAPDAKHLRLDGINPVLAMCLQELPAILERRDSPAARPRLFPNPTTGDAKANDDWQQLVAPELRHLFVSAGQTLEQDLMRLDAGSITFPAAHANAWVSALNQARLILAELHRVTDMELNPSDFDIDNPKHRAMFLIDQYGEVLHLFVEHEQR